MSAVRCGAWLGVLFVAVVTADPLGIPIALLDLIIPILFQSSPHRLFTAVAATIDFFRVEWRRKATPRICRDFGQGRNGAFGKLTCARNVSQMNKVFDAPLSFRLGQRGSFLAHSIVDGTYDASMLICAELDA